MKRNCLSGRVPSSSATKAKDGGDASSFLPRSAKRRAGMTSDKGLVGGERGPSAFLRRYKGFHRQKHKGKNECRDLKIIVTKRFQRIPCVVPGPEESLYASPPGLHPSSPPNPTPALPTMPRCSLVTNTPRTVAKRDKG